MTRFRQACARIGVAASLLCANVSGADWAQAAGALAIGQCGAYGLSYDYDQVDAATAAALGQCSGECKVATSMRGNCAALSIDIRNTCGAYGYAAAPRLGQAQNTALRYCYRNGGKDCVIRAWVCDAKG
ncbi:MAG TPA: DUF4189 domain-containing protein [Xanthobacteraceae bacterium]